MFLDTFRAGVL